MRDAQAFTAATVPHTAMAVLVDLGEEGDIHPRNKRDAGERLARVALANAYNRKIEWAAPQYASMSLESGAVRIRFQSNAGKLVARPLPDSYRPRSTQPAIVPLRRNSPDSELEGFAICGPERGWT